jgi:hypothetical protein
VQLAPDFMLANRVCCPRLRCQLQGMPFDLLNRRKLIAALGGATAWPLTARAQQPARPRRIGVLMSTVESDPIGLEYITAFAQGLAELV